MNKYQELDVEDILLIIYIILTLLNLYGNYNSKIYLQTDDVNYKLTSNKIFRFTLSVTLLIYIYFFIRNYNSYKNVGCIQKGLYSTKVFGTIFLIAGILCLLYFQNNETNFINTPAA